MSRLLLFFKKYPLALLATALFVPVYIDNPGISTANLAILIAAIIFSYIFLLPGKYYKIGALSGLILVAILYLWLPFADYLYAYTLFILAAVILLVYLVMRLGVNERQKQVSSRLLISGLVAIVILPLICSVLWWKTDQDNLKKISKSGQEIESIIDRESSTLVDKSSNIAEDPFIIDLLRKSSYDDLLGYIQNSMVSNNLSYIAIIGLDGRVLARAHNPSMIGDDYMKIAPAISESQNFGGVYREGDKIFVAHVKEIESEQKIASIVIGKYLDSNLFSDIINRPIVFSWLDNDKAFNSVGNDSYKSLFDSLSQDQLHNLPNYHYYDYQNNKLIIGQHQLNKYSQQIAIAVPQDTGHNNYYIIIIVIASIILLFWAGSMWQGLPFRKSNRNYFRIQAKKAEVTLEHLCEAAGILILVAIIIIKSSDAYLVQKTDRQIVSNAVASVSEKPYFELVVPEYADQSQPIPVVVKTDRLASSTATIRVSLKYQPEQMVANDVDISDSECDKVFDRSIDNTQGYINFSCVTKPVDSQSNLPHRLFSIKFRAISTGFTSLIIDKTYSNISTERGESNEAKQSSGESDNILIY